MKTYFIVPVGSSSQDSFFSVREQIACYKHRLGREKKINGEDLIWSKNNPLPQPSNIVWSSLWDYYWIKEVYYFFGKVKGNSPMYKYKFRQIFKKIGKIKDLDLSYVFGCLLRCCSFLKLNDESEKQTHLCRTIVMSDYSYAPVLPSRTQQCMV